MIKKHIYRSHHPKNNLCASALEEQTTPTALQSKRVVPPCARAVPLRAPAVPSCARARSCRARLLRRECPPCCARLHPVTPRACLDWAQVSFGLNFWNWSPPKNVVPSSELGWSDAWLYLEMNTGCYYWGTDSKIWSTLENLRCI